ncbi:MAG: BTAD domain-containing putative transcriptional regulator [Anaerolineae bacterium]
MGDLRFYLFGGFRMVQGDLPETKVARTVQLLLAYLLLHKDRTHSREKLANLFWSDYDQNRARTCLRTALCRTRRLLEPPDTPRGTFLLTTTDEIGFEKESDCWLDVVAFEAQVSRTLLQPIHAMEVDDAQELESALQLYTGDFLESFYDDWVLWERERLQRLYLNSLAHLLRYHKHHRAYTKGLECGREILLRDPLREEIHREMMQLYLNNGQRALAVRQYETCREILEAELGIQPMEETRELENQITSKIDLHQAQSIDPDESPHVQLALQQVRLGIKKLQDAQAQLQQAIQFFERTKDLDTRAPNS